MKIRILSHDVELIEDDPHLWSSGGMGRSCVREGKIVICSNMPADQQFSTLMHECIHHIADLQSVELSEQDVDGLAMGIHTLLKDNTEYMKQRMDALHK